MAKSYKQLYEELKEQSNPITEDEIEALKVVARGCNSNMRLRGHSEYVNALVKVYELIERLSV